MPNLNSVDIGLDSESNSVKLNINEVSSTSKADFTYKILFFNCVGVADIKIKNVHLDVELAIVGPSDSEPRISVK
jgi:hypothetical protein